VTTCDRHRPRLLKLTNFTALNYILSYAYIINLDGLYAILKHRRYRLGFECIHDSIMNVKKLLAFALHQSRSRCSVMHVLTKRQCYFRRQ
jgi:hypothetical protein